MTAMSGAFSAKNDLTEERLMVLQQVCWDQSRAADPDIWRSDGKCSGRSTVT